jgi:exopolysaccharide biosynthesis polyprenyl glycosylphosphotransferase
MGENRRVRKRDTYKRLITSLQGAVLLGVEMFLFGMMWYNYYETTLELPFFRRGNWAVVGMYGIIIFLFTKLYGGYRVGFFRILDIVYSQLIALVCANVVGYLQLCLICRDYVNPVPLVRTSLLEVVVIIVWIFACRILYAKMYPPRHLLLVYGYKTPMEFIEKINARKDKYVIEDRIHVSEGEQAIKEKILQYDGVIICETKAYIRNELVKYCFENSVRSYVVPKLSDIIILGAEPIHLFDTPLLLSRNQGLTGDDQIIKRIMDIVCATILLIVASPFMLISAAAIWIYDRGPVFYRQDRLTLNGKVFKIIKFRSMKIDSEEHGAQLAKKEDDRITPVGKVLRKLHLDELPQLFNILKGDMSMVGPRPERPEIAELYKKTFPEFDYRLKMKAGLTGYAQVYGKYNTTPRDKLKLDLTYYEKYTIWLDIKLMLLTVKIMFQKETSEGVSANMTTALREDGKPIQVPSPVNVKPEGLDESEDAFY